MRSFYIGDDVQIDDSGRPDLAVVALGGEVDYEVSPQLRSRIVRAIKEGKRRLIHAGNAVLALGQGEWRQGKHAPAKSGNGLAIGGQDAEAGTRLHRLDQ